MNKEKMKWYSRKRLWCGLPWTFTKYGLNEDRIFIEKGLFNITETEVRLYRIINISLKRNFIQRIFGLGTIHIDSNDKDLSSFDIINVKNSSDVKELISQAVEEERHRNKVSSREFMGEGFHDDEDLDGSDDDEH